MNGIHHWKQLRQCLKYSHLKEATIFVYHSTQKKSNFYKVITKDYDPQAIYGINDWLTKEYEYDYLITNPRTAIKMRLLNAV